MLEIDGKICGRQVFIVKKKILKLSKVESVDTEFSLLWYLNKNE